MQEINKKILGNLISAIATIISFFIIALGSVNIKSNAYITDVRVFSFILLAIAIFLFEIAYKKEDNKLAICGIETLSFAIIMLLLQKIYIDFLLIYPFTCIIISILYAIYFVLKSIISYLRVRKQLIYSQNDIKDIV